MKKRQLYDKESNHLCLGVAKVDGTDHKGFMEEETKLRLKELIGVAGS